MADEVKFVKVARVSDIPIGEGKVVFGAQEEPIAVSHHECTPLVARSADRIILIPVHPGRCKPETGQTDT